MKVLLLDNYDSFTFNLVHALEKFRPCNVTVVKNDQLDLDDVKAFDRVVLSPGPGLPAQAGCMPELIATFAEQLPMLGVCLGMQALGEYCGTPLLRLERVCHGIATPIHLVGDDPLFAGCPSHFNAGRYHSWVLDHRRLSADLRVIATDNEGYVMAVRHRALPLAGVQFHPESVLSEQGERILHNWLAN